jgi:hypothetical protein
MKTTLICFVVAAMSSVAVAQKTEFSGARAYDNLKVLAGEIGPRPMGSPAEQRAMEYAVSKFKEYGCQEAYVMPMTVAEGINTRSGVAVGVSRGTTGRMIVIGGHIDSAGPEIPGANDDGSGAATVIELARVICKRQKESTVVFCCWGGEEEGLRGSEFFVNHFAQLDSVVLMLQIDMADGSGCLEVDPDGPYQVSAPEWLVRASFDIARRELGYADVMYPTQFMTLNSLGGGASGSDHQPFLQKGIPAIDFTSDVAYPIHTPLDNLQTFNPAGLARSGDIVLRLFERFDGGVPSRQTEKYFLIQFGARTFFFSHWILWVYLAVVIIIAVAALLRLQKRRSDIEPGVKIRWSGIKIFFFATVIQIFVWFSENVVGLIRGFRFPWVNNYGGFVLLGILSGFIGLWLMLRLAMRWRITEDAFGLYLRAFIVLMLIGILFALPGPELAVYPASALLLLALALLVRQRLLKIIFALAAPYVMIRLLFVEDLQLFLRELAKAPSEPSTVVILIHAGLIGLFTLFSLPFAYGLVAVARDAQIRSRLFLKFRSYAGLGVTTVVTVMMIGYLATRQVYDGLWERDVRVEQKYHIGSDTSTVQIRSSEFLDGLHVIVGSRDTVLEGRLTKYAPAMGSSGAVPWLTVERSDHLLYDSTSSDSALTLRRDLTLRSAIRPFIVEVHYYGIGIRHVSSPWAMGARRRAFSDSPNSATLSWYAFPDSILTIPVTLTLLKGTHVSESIIVTYDTLWSPVRVIREFTYATYRTMVTADDTLRAGEGKTFLADAEE